MKSNQIKIAIFLLIIGFVGQMCTSLDRKQVFTSNPISAVGHGVILGTDGKEINPDSSFIKAAQEYYIDDLLNKDEKNKEFLKKKQAEINGEVADKILRNALFIDFLIEKVKPTNYSKLSIINNFLRIQYITLTLKKSILPENNKQVWAKGLNFTIAQKLENLDFNVFSNTQNSGQAYCNECIAAGVPVPKEMFSNEWKFQGIIENEFISSKLQAELWSFESISPKGVCLALPRYYFDTTAKKATDDALLFGVICLGTETGKVCFFDNPPGVVFKRNEKIDFKNWVGGSDLIKNPGGGMCTDCHAGENPFIVHPNKSAFAGIIDNIKSSVWYDPIVDASWVQNPGPSTILDNLSSTKKCTSCHNKDGDGGRFPEINAQMSGYCSCVLEKALFDASTRTMPPNKSDSLKYKAHIEALKARCDLFFKPL